MNKSKYLIWHNQMGKTEKLKREKQREKEMRLDRDRRLLETNEERG